MSKKNGAWTQERWRSWLESTNLDREVKWAATANLERTRREIGLAWKVSLACGCGSATSAVLALGWSLPEPYRYSSNFLGLLFTANAVALAVWFAVYWFREIRPSTVEHYVADEIGRACSETALDVCARALWRRESRLREISLNRKVLVEAAIRSTLQQVPFEELENQLLSKLRGARFVESGDGDLQIFSVEDYCERCRVRLRSSRIRRLAVHPLRAQAAGLERAELICGRPIKMRFTGSGAQFQEFFGRSLTSTEEMRVRIHPIEIKLCSSCSETALSTAYLHARPEDEAKCPVYGSAITDAWCSLIVDGPMGGHLFKAVCENCSAILSRLGDEGEWAVDRK